MYRRFPIHATCVRVYCVIRMCIYIMYISIIRVKRCLPIDMRIYRFFKLTSQQDVVKEKWELKEPFCVRRLTQRRCKQIVYDGRLVNVRITCTNLYSREMWRLIDSDRRLTSSSLSVFLCFL